MFKAINTLSAPEDASTASSHIGEQTCRTMAPDNWACLSSDDVEWGIKYQMNGDWNVNDGIEETKERVEEEFELGM